jgi:hypothetical protein
MPFNPLGFPSTVHVIPGPDPLPGPVPVPFANLASSSVDRSISSQVLIDLKEKENETVPPNWSALPTSLPPAKKINVIAAMARGFSRSGATQIYIQGQLPNALPDKLRLANLSPDVSKVLVSMTTPTPPPASASASSTPTASTTTTPASSGSSSSE